MPTRIIGRCLAAVVLLAAGFTSSAALAEKACQYKLYSEWTKTSMLVCEMPAKGQSCGELPLPPGQDRQKAYASSTIEEPRKGCSRDNMIGVCRMKTTTMVFYEGDASSLELGCSILEGEWHIPTGRQRRDPEFIKGLEAKG